MNQTHGSSFAALLTAVLLPLPFTGQTTAAEPADIPSTISRSLAFLVKDSLQWKEDHDCLSCHHGAMVAWALYEADARGHSVDQAFLTELTHWIATSGDGAKRIPKRPKDAPRALNNYAVQMALGLAAKPNPAAEDSVALVAMRKAMRADQIEDGSWVAWPDTRPPIFGPSNAAITALATLAVAAGAEAAKEPESVSALDRGMQWLAKAPPDPETQAAALHLLVVKRHAPAPARIQPLIDQLLARQKPDGGWAQIEAMGSDAYATGQSLYALAEAGLPPDHPAIKRAHAFLLQTQKPDGSWPMISRPCPPTNKGSKNLIPIIGAGTSWGTLGLVRSSPALPAKLK